MYVLDLIHNVSILIEYNKNIISLYRLGLYLPAGTVY